MITRADIRTETCTRADAVLQRVSKANRSVGIMPSISERPVKCSPRAWLAGFFGKSKRSRSAWSARRENSREGVARTSSPFSPELCIDSHTAVLGDPQNVLLRLRRL